LAVNVTATAALIPFIAPLLGEDGTAVFFDDTQAKGKFFGTYGATKAAQIALAQSWQAESRKSGPTIKIVTPNPMPTATRARFYPGENRSLLNDPKGESKRLLADILDPTPSPTSL
jgi:NAD(P)-dependent dehydrogenase (short-subunit alcohol dehydrogenase family)